MRLFLFQGLHGLDDAAGAQAVGPQGHEVPGVVQVGDAAGGLDLHMGGHMGLEQSHILPGGSAAAEAGGGLDILRAGLGHHAAHLDLFGIGEHAGLDDDLQQLALAVGLYGADLVQHLIVQAVLYPADVDDHVDLGRAVVHGVGGLKALGGGGVVAVGEADDGADGDLARHILRRLLHIGGGDAHAGAAVPDAVVADGLDFVPGGTLGQQGMIHPGQNGLEFVVHNKMISFRMNCHLVWDYSPYCSRKKRLCKP